MRKHNYFVKLLKKANSFTDSLLKKNLNKLNFLFQRDKILDFTRPKRVFIFIVVIFALVISYLSIPFLYNKNIVITKLENQLSNKFNTNFTFSKDINYSLIPWPNFTFNNVSILEKNQNIANIDRLKIVLSAKNFFSLNNFKVDAVLLDNANFNLNNKNYDFFIKLLDNDFLSSDFEISNSNIFYRNIDNEVLIIKKIHKMKYYYDHKLLKNTLDANNEIFNIPYSFTLQSDVINKKIYSKINLNLLKLQLDKVYDYSGFEKNGLINLTHNKNNSEANYTLKKNSFNFNFFDKSINPKFNYNGNINFTPFFLNLNGDTENIDLSKFFSSDSILTQFFKTEILNNKNLNIVSLINSNKILPYDNMTNLVAKIKVEEGLIDIDNTKFSWANYVDFEISDSLLYINDNNLILDGKFILNINNFNEIYKFLQTPRNYRKQLKKIEFNFNYNFDQEIVNFKDIKINDETNKKVNKVLNQFISKKSKIENRIHFKNLMNEAIKSYAG